MKILLARPRGFCAGVDRAINIVRETLTIYGPPIYVKHAVVHNRHVIESLKQQGAVFVEEIQEIPEGSRVIFSAHGTSPAVFDEARKRNLAIIDAVCPLVTKVHNEVVRYAKEGYTILLIGHKGHVEVIGTSGEAPDNVLVIESAEEAERIEVPEPAKLAYTTQTTLSVDDAKDIIAVLRRRFPHIVGPSKSDICYATQNRQEAVKKLAERADVIFIIGSRESSNSNRMVGVARSCGTKAYLIDGPADINPEMFSADTTVGISSGASTPEYVVQEVIKRLRACGASSIEKLEGKEERIRFPLPVIQ